MQEQNISVTDNEPAPHLSREIHGIFTDAVPKIWEIY